MTRMLLLGFRKQARDSSGWGCLIMMRVTEGLVLDGGWRAEARGPGISPPKGSCRGCNVTLAGRIALNFLPSNSVNIFHLALRSRHFDLLRKYARASGLSKR